VTKAKTDKFESTVNVLSGNNITCAYSLSDEDFILQNQFLLLPKSKKFLRGLTDIASYYTNYHDPAVFTQHLPDNYAKQVLYSQFEKLRIAVIASHGLTGVKNNIENYYLEKRNQDTLNTYDNNINRLLQEWYIKLTNNSLVYNQEEFAKFSLKIINTITTAEEQNQLDELEIDPESLEEFVESDAAEVKNAQIPRSMLEASSSNNQKSDAIRASSNYTIFTTKYDEIIKASSLATKEEIYYLRKQLDKKLHELKIIDKKLLTALMQKLESRINKSYIYHQEEGSIDSHKISQIITSPDKLNIFKKQSDSKKISASLTLLIDNSGSMRGKPIATSAICAEVISFICNHFNIKCEILGFTTKEWRGGQSTKDWKNAGSEANPGRISDMRYIIYKAFNDKFSSAKLSIPVMMKEAILKENIDGEALEWAFKRLAKQGSEKKYMIVISDGAPLDETTCSNNPPQYLDQHLKYVINKIEKYQNIKTLAFGIGHDVTRYYSNSRKINDSENLLNEIILKLIEIC